MACGTYCQVSKEKPDPEATCWRAYLLDNFNSNGDVWSMVTMPAGSLVDNIVITDKGVQVCHYTAHTWVNQHYRKLKDLPIDVREWLGDLYLTMIDSDERPEYQGKTINGRFVSTEKVDLLQWMREECEKHGCM